MSPAWAKTDSTTASVAIANQWAIAASLANTIAARTAPRRPAMAPDHVLLGLTSGMSFGPPTDRPTKYEAMSVVQTVANKKMIARKPYSLSERSTMGPMMRQPA